jgi:hypothetical protein
LRNKKRKKKRKKSRRKQETGARDLTTTTLDMEKELWILCFISLELVCFSSPSAGAQQGNHSVQFFIPPTIATNSGLYEYFPADEIVCDGAKALECGLSISYCHFCQRGGPRCWGCLQKYKCCDCVKGCKQWTLARNRKKTREAKG